MELQVAAAPLVAVALQVAAGLQVAAAQVAALRRLPTGAVSSAPRMARAQRAVAPHKAHVQLRALADRKVLVDSEVPALDVPVTRSLQPILSRVVAQ